jgi:lysophospholipase L1-like esterase
LYPVTAAADSDPGIIIGFGDSVTEGCDVFAGNCGWDRSGKLGYEVELESQLQKSDRNYVVNNFGSGGETARDGLDRIEPVMDEFCNYGAEYILILEGTNDLLHGARGVDVKYYLGLMVDKSRTHGLVPLLATITPDPNPSHSYKNIPLMNEYIRDLASEKDVPLVDLYNEMNPFWDIYTPGCYGDRLHPNETGFKAMGQIWFESLAELIKPSYPLNSWLELLLKNPKS